MGLVQQEPTLFNYSIKDNILYGDNDASNEEVRNSADVSNALEFIENPDFASALALADDGNTMELKLKEYKSEGMTFKDVHVVTLKLTFEQNFAATQTEGMQFQKSRIVILDDKGKVLHVTGDGPTEVPVLAI